MDAFPLCGGCRAEFTDPGSRRHHAQTIACPGCGPHLTLYDADGRPVPTDDPVGETAALLDRERIVAIKGIGGFHIACVEEAAGRLKERLGRLEQPLAVMARPDQVEAMAVLSDADRAALGSIEAPIVVLEKRDPTAHAALSNLHTIGVMLPYTGLHHLLFERLAHPMLVMTSANAPGYPMVTGLDRAFAALAGVADFYLAHDRRIVNRCDDSVVRGGYLIRLSRGYAPLRTAVDLGPRLHPRRRARALGERDDLPRRPRGHLAPRRQRPEPRDARVPGRDDREARRLARRPVRRGRPRPPPPVPLDPVRPRARGRSSASRPCRSSTTWPTSRRSRASPASGSRSTGSGTARTARSGAARSSRAACRRSTGPGTSRPCPCPAATSRPAFPSGCSTASCPRTGCSSSSPCAAGPRSSATCSPGRPRAGSTRRSRRARAGSSTRPRPCSGSAASGPTTASPR